VNRELITGRIIAILLAGTMMAGLSACGSKTAETTAASVAASSDASATTTTTVATTVLTEYSGPLANDQEVTWEESPLDAELTLYSTVTAGEFLNVRKGPGTEYNKAGTLTRGQTVVVVARTGTGWYKTSDGFYVSETYLSATAPTA